jgi:pilus assembly protein FimV
MKPFNRIALALALVPALSSPALGLGLGDVKLMSYLNEPLRAEVALLDVKDLDIEDIRVRMATQEDFDRLGVERAYFLSSIQFQIVVDGASSKILMTTSEPLLEPYLDFLLETRWPDGRLLREYTVLVDLPKPIMVQTTPEPDPVPAQVTPPKNTVTTAPVTSKPKRKYDRDVGEQPAPGQRYLVQAQDSLWEIAAAGRPANASVAQTMIATVAMNSDAFQGANINGLKAGYVLEMPGPNDIYTSAAEAVAIVRQQNEDWAAGIMREPMLRVLADNEISEINESNTTTSDVGSDVTAAESSPSTVASNAFEPLVSAGEDLLQNTQSTTSSAGTTPGTDVNSADDQTQTTTTATIGSGGMNSVELAAIQRRLTELSDQVGDLRQLVTVKDRQIAALQAELAARDIATATAMAPAQQAQPSTQVRPANTGLPWWVYALGGVVVLAFAGVFIARRADRRYLATAGETYAPSRTSRALARADAARREMRADPQLSGHSLDGSAVEVGSISDAIAEADIYIAYGRYQQAIELLTSAAQTEPDNPIVYLKLVNTYLKTDRWHDAQALLTTLEGCGDPVVLDQAVALIEAHTPAVDDDLGLLASEPGTAPIARSGRESATIANTPQRESLTTGREALDPIEFEPVTTRQAPEASDDSVTETDAAVDTFDPEFNPVLNPDPDPELSVPSVSALDDFDLELELDAPFDSTDNTDVTSTARRAAEATSDNVLGSEWGGLSDSVAAGDDRLPPELAAVLGTDVPPPFEKSSYDEDDNTLIYAKDADPVDTKLDLARAYFDMGDEDGARPILEEIIAEGDLQQQAEARELLLRLD